MLDDTSHATVPRVGITSGGASLRIATVALTVRDLDRVSRFYQDVIGLRPIRTEPGRHQLGAGGRVLLDLRHDPEATLANRDDAGLFHVAFLLPTRADLADWMVHVADSGVRLEGASDHLVSEAFYLSDPEGNGIEVYWDRPSEDWTHEKDGLVKMATLPLNLRELRDLATGRPFDGMPGGTIVGHVHLQVGELKAAQDFYAGVMGFDVACHYPGATFLGADGYHHHIGTNVWNSRGAGRRPEGATGLAEVGLIAEPQVMKALASRLMADDDGTLAAEDPWGTRLRVAAA